MKRVLVVGFFVYLTISYFDTFEAMAQDTTFEPSLAVMEMYNSNYFFDRPEDEEKAELYIATITPNLKFDYSTQRLDLTSWVQLDIQQYTEEAQLNTVNQWYHLDMGYRATQGLNLLCKFSFVKDNPLSRTVDTSFESERNAIVVNLDSLRQVYSGEISLTQQVSSLSNIGLSYSYNKTEYKEEEVLDSEEHNIALSYDREFNEGHDILKAKPDYFHSESGESIMDNYGLSLGWSHLFSDTFSLGAYFGGRYSQEDFGANREDRNTKGVIAGFDLNKEGEKSSASIGYKFGMSPGELGESVELHYITSTLERKLNERLDVILYTLFYWPTETREDYESTAWALYSSYYEFAATLNYQIIKNLSLEFVADYALYPEADRERTRVWIKLKYSI